jgi:hypothetical protein
VQRKPYGLLVECVNNQDVRFQLWQPADGSTAATG